MLTRTARLPGIRFEVQAPTPTEILPRMDIAVFVGFAASGPLHRPVVVEDVAHFESIFGADAPLAWDNTRGEMLYAYLAPAVRAFFRNGGRRCWIIRVARQTPSTDASPPAASVAQSNYFQVPGLMRAEFDAQGQLIRVSPAFAQARSEGSWSDSIRLGSVLLCDTVVVNSPVIFNTDNPASTPRSLTLNLTLYSRSELALGDLLRLTFRQAGYQLLCVVDTIRPLTPSPFSLTTQVEVTASKLIWLQASWSKFPSSQTAQAYTFTHDKPGAPIAATIPLNQELNSPPFLAWPTSEQDANVKIDLSEALAAAPDPGTMFKLDLGGDEFWLMPNEFHASQIEGSPPQPSVQLVGEGWWRVDAPSTPPPSIPDGERLTFELWAWLGEEALLRLTALGFEKRNPRYWNSLPSDLELYPEPGTLPNGDRADLWQDAAIPRFPLAGIANADESNVVYLPLAMPLLPYTFLAADPVTTTPLERDGLSEFDASLFLDDKLNEVGVPELLTTADYLRYSSPSPRALCGIHVAIGIEEGTLIVAPDAVHRGWRPAPVETIPAPSASPPLPRPSWWHWLDCQPDPHQPAPRAPSSTRYPNAPSNILAPLLERQDRADEPGVLIFVWSLLMSTDVMQLTSAVNFILEEATQPDFSNATTIYQGAEQKALLYGRLPGDYYYRMRAVVNGASSDWSNALVVRVPVGTIPLTSHPVWGNFLDCGIVILQPPCLLECEQAAGGTCTLKWESIYDTTFILEEATTRDFEGAVVIYTGAVPQFVIYGRSPGDYFYRVRAVVNGESSDWSNGVAVRVAPPKQWMLNSSDAYAADTLLAVQRSLLRMCAARGDLFAVLAMPEHYRENEMLFHAAALTAPTFDTAGADDARTFSFGAVYHPWLIGSDHTDADLQRVPPDGAMCGVIAQRAFNRGAWIAPANEPLAKIVALTPPIQRERWLDLQTAQINLIRQEPRGFMALNSDTLSSDEDIRLINVRRLLSLLRRLALKLGASYVFELNDDSFRRMVQRGFEAMLNLMFTRGAFAGSTPATSYQVVTDSSVNTPQSIELGRFIVELRVAPSLPLTFLTVRLMQSGERTAVTEVR